MALAPETVLQGRYRIVRQLGKGGMGAVYEAIDQRLGITVALKETFSVEASVRKQFEQEARLLASLQHPALPRVSDHFTEGNRAFLVMQFISGVDLARIIYQQPGPFPREQVVAWADQLLDALIYLHSQDRQVIHRDIKPHNLKLTATGQIALLDFGLAKAQTVEASTTSSAPFFGYTRQYAPLEQIQAQAAGPGSDIYALGATLYHLLTGVKPADALSRAAALANGEADPLKPADVVHPTVGRDIAAILAKAMSQNSDQRFRSAAEFREALRRIGRRPSSRSHHQLSSPGSVLFAEPADETSMFQSLQVKRTHGHAFVTSIMLIVLTAAGGLFYGYPQLRTWLESQSIKVRSDVPPVRNSGPAQQPDQSNSNAPAKSPTSRSTESPARGSRFGEKGPAPNSVVADQLRRLDRVKLADPNIASQPSRDTTIESSRGIKIPNIRLPAAETLDHKAIPAAEPRLIQTYRPTTRPVTPWSLKTSEGELVKGAEGSPQVFKPSETGSRVSGKHN